MKAQTRRQNYAERRTQHTVEFPAFFLAMGVKTPNGWEFVKIEPGICSPRGLRVKLAERAWDQNGRAFRGAFQWNFE
jgi:hypothetical protein